MQYDVEKVAALRVIAQMDAEVCQRAAESDFYVVSRRRDFRELYVEILDARTLLADIERGDVSPRVATTLIYAAVRKVDMLSEATAMFDDM